MSKSDLDWAVEQWKNSVANRPLNNIYRRKLDDVWRNIVRKLGGNDLELLGPSHDQLVAESQATKSKTVSSSSVKTQSYVIIGKDMDEVYDRFASLLREDSMTCYKNMAPRILMKNALTMATSGNVKFNAIVSWEPLCSGT